MNKKNKIINNNSSNGLLGDIRKMIEASRASVAMSVHAVLSMLYRRIGNRAIELSGEGLSGGQNE